MSASGSQKQWKSAPEMAIDLSKRYAATLHTTKGDVTVDLLATEAPRTVNNFVFLAREGFYDGVPFHRIIKGFMIQTGDPLGTGTGGPGYTFDDEIHPELTFSEPYLLAMANAGKRRDPITGKVGGTNGSQFFISVAPTTWLTGKHTIFGKVADDASRAVVDTIAATRTGRGDRPVEDITIQSVSIED